MGRRISQLEDALEVEFGTHADGVHPLLTDELLEIKKGASSGNEQELDGDIEVLNVMGLLAVNVEGAENFLGATETEVRLLASTVCSSLNDEH